MASSLQAFADGKVKGGRVKRFNAEGTEVGAQRTRRNLGNAKWECQEVSSGAKAHRQRVVYVGAEAPTPEMIETTRESSSL